MAEPGRSTPSPAGAAHRVRPTGVTPASVGSTRPARHGGGALRRAPRPAPPAGRVLARAEHPGLPLFATRKYHKSRSRPNSCLLYTSDAADDLLCVDLGGRRIIKKKK